MGTLLPKHNDQYYDILRDFRQNKGSILKASVDYIKILKKEKEKKTFMEEKCRKLEQVNRKALLKIQVLSLLTDSVLSWPFSLKEYEQIINNAGLSVEQTVWRPATSKQLEGIKARQSDNDINVSKRVEVEPDD